MSEVIEQAITAAAEWDAMCDLDYRCPQAGRWPRTADEVHGWSVRHGHNLIAGFKALRSEIARLARELEEARERDLIPLRYEIHGTAHPTPYDVVTIEVRERDGERAWVVFQHGNVLNHKGKWEWEPQPSSRTDKFVQRTRYATPDGALAAYRALATPQEASGPPMKNDLNIFPPSTDFSNGLTAVPSGAAGKHGLEVGDVNVVWHDLPLSVLTGFTGLSEDELDGAQFHGTSMDDGGEASMTFAEALKSIEAQRAWGYYDKPRQEIHAWVAADCELGFAVHFIAHELAHATGLDTPGPADTDDEMRAELVGEIARHAYEIAADRLAYLQSRETMPRPAPPTRDRKGAAMHALITDCADLWADMDAEEREEWIGEAERYEEPLRGGIAALEDLTTTTEEEDGPND